MKNQNKKTILMDQKPKMCLKKLVRFVLVCMGLSFFLYAFADDIQILIARQVATGFGSNNGQVIFSHTGGIYQTYYIEKGANSTIVGNYLKGYYYNSTMGFFQLDWSEYTAKNVSIISSTEKCATSYGYKLGGNAYSDTYGFIDFDYSDDIFVYYCEGDRKLHGFGYSKYAGFQNFEGIGFELLALTGGIVGNTNSDLFVNDITSINKKTAYTGANSNYNSNGIGGDIFSIDDTKESMIYIIR